MAGGGVLVCVASSMLPYENRLYAHLDIVCEWSKYQLFQIIYLKYYPKENWSPVKVYTTFASHCITIQMKCKCVNPWLPLPSLRLGPEGIHSQDRGLHFSVWLLMSTTAIYLFIFLFSKVNRNWPKFAFSAPAVEHKWYSYSYETLVCLMSKICFLGNWWKTKGNEWKYTWRFFYTSFIFSLTLLTHLHLSQFLRPISVPLTPSLSLVLFHFTHPTPLTTLSLHFSSLPSPCILSSFSDYLSRFLSFFLVPSPSSLFSEFTLSILPPDLHFIL